MNHPIFNYTNPVLFSIGPLKASWYGLSYVLGLIIGEQYCLYLSQKYKLNITKNHINNFILWIAVGIVVGGRLGYVLFYDFNKYFNDPVEIFLIYKGGLSFHGGLIGSIIGIILFSKKYRLNLLNLLDLLVISSPIGIFFGRISNFINLELVGRETNGPFGIIFPGDTIARHPSQLYEALFEGLISFLILSYLNKKYYLLKNPGIISIIGIILYSLFRILIEFFREPDYQIGYILIYFTMGQILSFLTLIILVAFVMILRQKHCSSIL